MRRLLSLLILLIFLSIPALSQVQTCTITGTLYRVDGVTPAAYGELTITQTVAPGGIVSTRPIPVRANASGVVSFSARQSSVLTIKGDFYGLTTGATFTVPSGGSCPATLEGLVSISQIPTTGLTVKDEGVSLSTLIGTVNFVGSGVSVAQSAAGSATVTISGGGGGGGGSLTAREVDGSPSITATILEFNQADGLVLTDQTGEVARLSLSGIPQARVSNLTTDLAGKQGLDATLTALAGLNSTAGLLEQTGADAFTKRAIGVAASTDVPTRADADARFAALSHTHAQSEVTSLVADLAGKAPTTRTVSAGTGLTGGGDLSANRTLSLDINGLTEETTIASGDFVAIYDASASALRKMTRANFVAGLSGGGSSLTLNGQTGTTQTFSNTDDTNVTLTITSATDNHAFALGWTGTLAKARQNASTVYTDQANTFGNFIQTFQAGANHLLIDPTDTTKKFQFDVSNVGTGVTRTVNIPNANSTTVQANTGSANNFVTAISAQGVVSIAQPSFSNLSGSATTGQLPSTTVNSVVNDTNVTGSISAQALTLGWTGTLAKARQNASTVYNDAANTWSTGVQDFGSAASLKVPTGAGAAPTANGLIAYDSTANAWKAGVNGASKTFLMTDGSGANLTALNASQLTSGTVDDARLSANVSLLGSSIDLSGAEATGTLAAGRFPALTGDVTTTAGSLTATIANGAVTNAKLANSSLTVTAGAGLSGGGSVSLGGSTSLSLNLAGLSANQTIFDSANASRTITFGLSGATDPVVTVGDNSFDISTGVLKQGGTAVSLAGHAHAASDVTSGTFAAARIQEVIALADLSDATAKTGSGTTVVMSVSPVLTTPDLGTPSAVTLTNGTALPISTGVSGLGTGIATFLATPTSANLAATITNETGSGQVVFAISPSLTTPDIGAATGTSITVGNTGLKALDTNGSHNLTFAPGSDLTVNRTLTVTTGDADRTLTLGGNATLNGGTHSGTNTGDQTITLTGDVTGSGTGSFAATIANSAVTFAKFQNINTDSLVGRDTAGTGAPEAIGLAGSLIFTGSQTIQLSGDSASPGTSRYYGTDSGGTKGWFALPSGGGYATIQEEGTGLTQRTTLNFVGSSATAADDTTRTTVTFDSDLDALASNSTNGLWARTGTGTGAARTITGTTNQVNVSNGDGVSGNPTLSLPQNIHTSATPQFAGLTSTGNLAMSGTGLRFTADFSNATLANRFMFQSSTTNGSTFVSALPNGTDNFSGFVAYNSSSPSTAHYFRFFTNSTSQALIDSGKNGGGAIAPIAFAHNTAQVATFTTGGHFSIGASGTDGAFLTVQGGIATAITSTGSTTLNDTHSSILCNASGGAQTYTLPAGAAAFGRVYTIKKTDSSSNACIIDADSNQTIDGHLIVRISGQNESLTIQSDGTNWRVINSNIQLTGQISGLVVSWASSSTVSVSPGSAQIQSTGAILTSASTLTSGTITRTTTLSASVGDGTAGNCPTPCSVSITDGSWMPSSMTIKVDNEQMSCTRSSNTLTCTRGFNGSTAATHSNGATVNAQFIYYVYAYDNSGTAAIEVTTTAPAAAWYGTARSKTGDTSRRFVGAVPLSFDGNLANVQTEGSSELLVVRYLINTTSLNRMLTNQSQDVNTVKSLATVLPVGARAFEATIYNLATTGIVYFDTSEAGPSGTGLDPENLSGLYGQNPSVTSTTWLPVNASQEFRYAYHITPTGSNFLFLDVLSFRLQR